MREKNVFIVGDDPFHHPLLETLPAAETCRFHSLLAQEELRNPRSIPIRRLLAEARAQLDAFPGSVDGICAYWDFPASCIAPMLAAERGLPGVSLEAVLRCEHKYWSRLEQQAVIPERVPAFCVVDPLSDSAAEEIPLDYPFWLKPVKSFNSYLGFRIDGPDDFRRAIARARVEIAHVAEPFDFVLEHVEKPEAIRDVGGHACLAEAIISGGRQCTLEGYGFAGDIEVYGAVDSHTVSGGSSFAHYTYPSTLPEGVLREMTRATKTLMRHIGFDGGPFNVEFFWDEAREALWLLEVNARISQSHAELFAQVDGQANHGVSVDLALGRAPRHPRREGRAPRAAKFFLRAFDDGVVTSAPTPEALGALERTLPGVRVRLVCRPGQRLSDASHQDSYSYELAWIYVAGETEAELLDTYRTTVERLKLEIDGRRVHADDRSPHGPAPAIP
jgi:hypothetical protein